MRLSTFCSGQHDVTTQKLAELRITSPKTKQPIVVKKYAKSLRSSMGANPKYDYSIDLEYRLFADCERLAVSTSTPRPVPTTAGDESYMHTHGKHDTYKCMQHA